MRRREFRLTYAEFCALAEASGYDRNAGREVGCLHIDRIDPRLGYVPGNVRALEASENSRKGYVDRLVRLGLAEPADFSADELSPF